MNDTLENITNTCLAIIIVCGCFLIVIACILFVVVSVQIARGEISNTDVLTVNVDGKEMHCVIYDDNLSCDWSALDR